MCSNIEAVQDDKNLLQTLLHIIITALTPQFLIWVFVLICFFICQIKRRGDTLSPCVIYIDLDLFTN